MANQSLVWNVGYRPVIRHGLAQTGAERARVGRKNADPNLRCECNTACLEFGVQDMMLRECEEAY
jgi:hypothetical protein